MRKPEEIFKELVLHKEDTFVMIHYQQLMLEIMCNIAISLEKIVNRIERLDK